MTGFVGLRVSVFSRAKNMGSNFSGSLVRVYGLGVGHLVEILSGFRVLGFGFTKTACARGNFREFACSCKMC